MTQTSTILNELLTSYDKLKKRQFSLTEAMRQTYSAIIRERPALKPQIDQMAATSLGSATEEEFLQTNAQSQQVQQLIGGTLIQKFTNPMDQNQFQLISTDPEGKDQVIYTTKGYPDKQGFRQWISAAARSLANEDPEDAINPETGLPIPTVEGPSVTDVDFLEMKDSFVQLANQARSKGVEDKWTESTAFLSGKAGESLQRKVETCQGIELETKDGALMLEKSVVDDSTKKKVAQSIKRVLEMATRGPQTKDDIDDFKNHVAIYQDKLIFRDPGDPATGIIVGGKVGLLPYRFAIDLFFEKAGERYPEISPRVLVPEVVNKRADVKANDIGFVAEGFESIVGAIIKGDTRGALQKLALLVGTKRLGLMKGMKFITDIDTLDRSIDVASADTHQALSTIHEHFGDDPLFPLIRRLGKLAATTGDRAPDMVTHTGGQTVGLIAKDDTLETYLNPIDAKERFLAQGFSDEQVEALFRYRSDGTVEVGNAIKTYMSPNKVKLGELTLERTLQTVTDPEPRERRFIYQSFDALGIQDRDVVNNYMKDLQTKMGAIDKVFGTGIVRGEDGSPLSAKSIKTSFAHQIRNTLASHLTYKELNTNALVGMLDRFDVEDETAVSRVQEMLTRRLTIARMNKDIGEGVPGARETAAMMIRMNACSLQETMLDVRGITESEHYICLNNDVIDRGL